MAEPPSVLVIQTAFAGDLILTLPLIQECHRAFETPVDVLCLPSTEEILEHHPSIRLPIAYDKHGGTDSLTGIITLVQRRRYNVCITPHRSFRSALISRFSGASIRIGFDIASGSWLGTHRVPYDPLAHEIERNLSLLHPVFPEYRSDTLPDLYPGEEERRASAECREPLRGAGSYICIAPGSVWATKRWTPDGFTEVARTLSNEYGIVMIGGSSDTSLCGEICSHLNPARVVDASGKLSFLEAAAMIEDAALVISNDSAPIHIATAMRTPVVEIFGATIPAFGFTPKGVAYEAVGMDGLPCRPCGIHGGTECPIGSLACMKELEAGHVIAAARRVLTFGSPKKDTRSGKEVAK